MFDFTVAVLDGAHGTSVSVTLDLLRTAEALAARARAPVPRWRLCSMDGGPVQLQSGLSVQTQRLPPATRSDASMWIVPGLGLNTADDVRARMDAADAQWWTERCASHIKRGGSVAAGCSAVFLLQRAGVLDGRAATTTWWLAPLLQRLAPGCQVDASRMVCADGPVVTGGAAFAQIDLMLHLLRELCGARLVDSLSRFLLVDARAAQSPYVVPEVLANGDALVGRIVERVEAGLPAVPSVKALAAAFCVSERTLARHVRRVTGHSTLDLVQAVRLRKARSLLEQSRMSVEQVAFAVGYTDPTALRRLMRRVAGANPSQYRPAGLPVAEAAGAQP